MAYQTSDIEQQQRAAESGVQQTVDGIFKSDDKLLLSLQKLASDLDPGSPENDGLIERIRELCARLIKHTVEGIRTRLDRIYLEALSNLNTTNGHGSDGQEVIDLQDELESLYSEILPVAQMSAEQQFLQPALRTIAASGGRSQERAVKAVKYVSIISITIGTILTFNQIHHCLVFLVNRIEAFLERAEESQCHKMALRFVLDSAKKELARTGPPVNKPVSPVRPNTQRRRTSSTSKSPVKPRNVRRRSSGHMDDDVEPEQQLARHLGINLPAESASEPSRIDHFERILSDRKKKLGIHATSLESTTESAVSSHLSDAHITFQLLQDSLLAESLYHRVQLLDPEIEASVETFEQDVQYVQKSLEEIDLQQLQTKNVHRDQIIERWSR